MEDNDTAYYLNYFFTRGYVEINKSATIHFMPKELAVVHGDERVAEEGAEEIEDGDDAVGVVQGHGRAS